VCLLGLLLAALTLAACGGASSTAGSSSAKASALSAAPAAPTATSKPGTAAKGTTAHTGKPAQGAAGSGSAAQTQFKQALSSFAACLRGNGVKLPAAKSGQALSLKGVDTKSAEYRSAVAKCRPVLSAALKSVSKTRPAPATPAAKPTAGTGSPGTAGNSPPIAVKVPASVTTVMQRFTACMRSNGITGFPEPKGASFDLTGTSVDPNTATYKEAQTKCNPILRAMVPKG